MHSVGHIDWSFVDSPAPASATASGLARLRIVGPEQGAVHTDLAAIGLQPGGWLAPHVHSFEEALYVLTGELLVDLGGRVHRLVGGDFALIPTGLRHALGNSATEPTTFLSLTSPQRQDPSSGRRDTWFEPAHDLDRMDADATRPPPPPGRGGPPRGPPRVGGPRPCVWSATTKAPARRSTRSGSAPRPAAALPPVRIRRSSRTAGSR